MKTKIDWVTINWVLYCSVLGIIGWTFKNPESYQPLIVWVIGSMFIQTIMTGLSYLISSLFTSLIFINYNDCIKELAYLSLGRKPPKNTKISNYFCYGLTVVLHISYNLLFLYGITNLK